MKKNLGLLLLIAGAVGFYFYTKRKKAETSLEMQDIEPPLPIETLPMTSPGIEQIEETEGVPSESFAVVSEDTFIDVEPVETFDNFIV